MVSHIASSPCLLISCHKKVSIAYPSSNSKLLELCLIFIYLFVDCPIQHLFFDWNPLYSDDYITTSSNNKFYEKRSHDE